MKALIVGAGAVGQVFGRHLALGGAEVTFYVKPKYLTDHFTMYPLNHGKAAVRFTDFAMVTSFAGDWDQIYLTVSSTALREGSWLAELGKATGDATVVMLQPSLDDRAIVEESIDPARIVDGMIGFISYHAPLPDERGFAEPGMAYWFPPGSPSPFAGAEARVAPVVAALRAGKLPATRKRELGVAYASAVLFAVLGALEANHWRFSELRRELGFGARAARSAIAVAAASSARKPSLAVRLAARPFALRFILRVVPWFMPLPLEAYMKAHFTKVSDQTRLALRTYVERGRVANLDVAPLEVLVDRLR